MALPHLIHPVDVVVEQIAKTATVYDPDTREPVQQASRAVRTTVPGQPRWHSQGQEESRSGGGIVEGSDGYVVFRKVDLDAASLILQREDRFAKMGHVETDVYVTSIEWQGHYPDQGGPSLLKAHFEDRGPSRQTRG